MCLVLLDIIRNSDIKHLNSQNANKHWRKFSLCKVIEENNLSTDCRGQQQVDDVKKFTSTQLHNKNSWSGFKKSLLTSQRDEACPKKTILHNRLLLLRCLRSLWYSCIKVQNSSNLKFVTCSWTGMHFYLITSFCYCVQKWIPVSGYFISL